MKKKIHRNFLILAPVLILLGAGILVKSLKQTSPQMACSPSDFSGAWDPNATLAIFDGQEIAVPESLASEKIPPVLGVANPSDRWIEIDLSDQSLRAWDGNTLFLETRVSSGLPHTPTPEGEFRIWTKLRATKMEGGAGRYYYYLPNVPYVMFFENSSVPGWRGYSLHGTYWHSDFGTRRSHGCVNLPTPIAEKLYYWTTPTLPQGKNIVYSSAENPGTRIIIHQ
jgi:lipoprotein-anchoring transpeptidase ErfK/SrfK